jgi:transcriptional regulator with XRE-family HTH domain
MFGKRLKDLREDNDLTQKEIADKLGIGIRTYQKYEVEEIEPKLSTLEYLADFYQCTLDYIMGRTNHPKEGIAEFSMSDHKVKVSFDPKVFPNGITEEKLVELLKKEYENKSSEIAKNILEKLSGSSNNKSKP